MKIAVLMPYYNVEKTVIETLESLSNQTYHDFDFFAVDNGSHDNSNEIIKEFIYRETEISFHNLGHFSQKGIVPALNTGLFHILADGRFDAVARLDADDTWMPEKLEKQVAFLRANPDVSILGTQFTTKPKGHEYDNPLTHDEIVRMMLSVRNPIAHPSVMIRTKVFYKCGVYEKLYGFCEDYQFWMKCATDFKFANLPDRLVEYRISDNPAYDPSAAMSCKLFYGTMISHLLAARKNEN
jgi:glycosyltransferase involved in cell wall biosynthesis